MRTTAIIAAGGRGRRMGATVPKQLLSIGGRHILQMSVEAFARHPRVDALVVVLPAELASDPPHYLRGIAKPARLVAGGQSRQESVANGLAAVDSETEIVLVHDAARPLVDAGIIDRVIDAAAESGAAICALGARDTIKLAETDVGAGGESAGAGNRWIARTLPRESVYLAQTPQAFRLNVLEDAVRLGQSGVEATDEAFLAEQSGHRVRIVEGSPTNMKITSADDLKLAQGIVDNDRGADRGSWAGLRVGCGYDLHRLVEGRRLVLGGVEVPFERGLLGHSDADVLCHAITDAVLGAAGAGDIGRHFPDTDERWRGASSLDLLRRAACVVRDHGFVIGNVDAVIVMERPKLLPHLASMTERIADALQIPAVCVSVKGKTNEGVGEVGRGEAVACHAVALVYRT